MKSVLAFCLAFAALTACGVKDSPAFPSGPAETVDSDAIGSGFDTDNGQGLFE